MADPMAEDELRAKILKNVLDLEYHAETESWGYTDGQGENEWFVTLHPAIIENMVIGVNAYTTNKIIEAIDHIYELSPTKNYEHWKPQDALAIYERLKAYEAELRKQMSKLFKGRVNEIN